MIDLDIDLDKLAEPPRTKETRRQHTAQMRKCAEPGCGNVAPRDNEYCNAHQEVEDFEHDRMVRALQDLHCDQRSYFEGEILALLADILDYIKK